jgi:putative transposase
MNSAFKEDTVFELNKTAYLVESIRQTPTTSKLYCVPYDTVANKALDVDTVKVFKERRLREEFVEGNVVFLDTSNIKAHYVELSQDQVNKRDMWVEFNEMHIARCGGVNLSVKVFVLESIDLFDWSKYEYGKPKLGTVQGYITKYRRKRDPRSVTPSGARNDIGESRFTEETQLLILKAATDHYLVKKDNKARTRNELAIALRNQIAVLKVKEPKKYPKIPCKQAIYDLFDNICPLLEIDKTLSRAERRQKKFKLKGSMISNYLMERVEIDAIYINLGLLDDDNNEYLGTVVLMCAIDVYSRCIVGYSYLIDENPKENTDLALECIKHMVSPKEEHPGAPYGIATTLAHDATTAMVGNNFKQVAIDLGMRAISVRTGHAWAKPFIERFFLTLRLSFLSKLPGYLGSKNYKGASHLNPEDTTEAHAQLTVSMFDRKLHDFIHNSYHVNAHAGLNKRAPIDVWNSECQKNPLAITAPMQNNLALECLGLESLNHTIYDNGSIKLKNERYRADELKMMYLLKVKKTDLMYSDINADKVVIKVADKAIAKKLGKTLIIAERVQTNYESSSAQRASLNAARNNVHSDIPEATSVPYQFGDGLKNIKGEQNLDSSSKIDNDKCIGVNDPDASEHMQASNEGWLGDDKTPKDNPTDTQSSTENGLVLGEEL